MKIMVVTPYLPHRRVGHGGGVAVRNLITWLARKHEVMVLSLVRPGEENLVSEVTELGVKFQGLTYDDSTVRGLKKLPLFAHQLSAYLRSLNSRYPLYVEKYRRSGLLKSFRQAVQDFAPDAIQFEYLQLSLWARELRQQMNPADQKWPRLIINTHELGSLPRQRRAERASNPFSRWAAKADAAAWQRLQVDATRWADTTLCVTPEDHALYAEMGGRHLVTVPLGMDLTEIKSDWQPSSVDGRETYLFVGSFGHRPNVLAAQILISDIWPRFHQQRPGAVLVLAGRGSDTFINAQFSQDQQKQQQIEALGFVDDLTPHFRNCRLFVAPLPEGGGIKIKILEAMARGVPIVTTTVGAEGIVAEADDILTISSWGPEFAEAMLAASHDLEDSRRQSIAGRKHMEAHFSWDAITDHLGILYAGGRQ